MIEPDEEFFSNKLKRYHSMPDGHKHISMCQRKQQGFGEIESMDYDMQLLTRRTAKSTNGEDENFGVLSSARVPHEH